LKIRYFTDKNKFNLKDKRKIKSWLITVANAEKKIIDNILYIFTSDKEIKKINKKFLNHNYNTDIITFDNSKSEMNISGEMYISIDSIKTNSREYNVSFENELHRVILHGLLHLCGYKDKSKIQKKIMILKENEYLNLLNI